MIGTKSLDRTRSKVRKLLKQEFGDTFHEVADDFVGREGTTIVAIKVLPWEAAGEVVVKVAGGVAMGADLTEESMRFLLERNAGFSLGAFSVEGDESIVFSHSIVASKLDKSELVASVRAVSTTADLFDDVITGKWGGRRIIDMLLDAEGPSEPQKPDDDPWTV